MKTYELALNAQQGLILTSDNDQIVGLYHHYQKAVVLLIPWTLNDIEISKEFAEYKKIERATDSVSACVWDNNKQRDTELTDFIIYHK